MKRTVLAAGILLSFTCLAADTLAGAGAGAINQTFNTSARFEGMGGAGVAVPWGGDTNHWANPAQLAFRPGVHYLHFDSRLAVGLADDIELSNNELTLGGWGVTLLWAKSPFAGNYLDMGTQEGRDENGDLTGTFESYMQTTTWGLGLDAVTLLEHILGRDDRFLTRWFSVAGGYTWSEFEDQLAPDWTIQDGGGGGSGAGSSTSRGLAIRVTPLDLVAGSGLAGNGMVGLRFSAGWGTSLINDSDEFIVHVDADQSDPFPRQYLDGWSFRVELPFAEDFRGSAGSFRRWVTASCTPLLSFTYGNQDITPGYVWDEANDTYVYERDDSGRYDEEGWGREIGFANLVFLRAGHFRALYGDIDDDTSGWGVQLPVGRYGGFRYDEATVPQAAGLPDVTRVSWSLWVDPLAIVQATRDR